MIGHEMLVAIFVRVTQFQDDLPSLEDLADITNTFPLSKEGYEILWSNVRTIRTFPEQMRSYLSAFKSGTAVAECHDLPTALPQEWKVLKDAPTVLSKKNCISASPMGRSISCPRCGYGLPLLSSINFAALVRPRPSTAAARS